MAVCAVMGHGLDLLDVDPRSGGDESRSGLQGGRIWPRAYAVAATPSGGTHDLVASLDVRSRDRVLPGLDIKAGTPEGGRGFAFIAPTVRESKTTGELIAYQWIAEPGLDALADDGDDSGWPEPAGRCSRAGSGTRLGRSRRTPAMVSPCSACRRTRRAKAATARSTPWMTLPRLGGAPRRRQHHERRKPPG